VNEFVVTPSGNKFVLARLGCLYELITITLTVRGVFLELERLVFSGAQ